MDIWPIQVSHLKILDDERGESIDGTSLSQKKIKMRLGAEKGERHWKIKGTRTEIKYMQDNTITHERAAYVRPHIFLFLDDRFTSSKYRLLGFISAVMPVGYCASPALLEFLPEKWPFSLFHFVEAMQLILV